MTKSRTNKGHYIMCSVMFQTQFPANRECTIVCHSRQRAVCGTDGQTHTSKCEIRKLRKCEGKNVRVKHRGRCRSKSLYSPMSLLGNALVYCHNHHQYRFFYNNIIYYTNLYRPIYRITGLDPYAVIRLWKYVPKEFCNYNLSDAISHQCDH